MRWNLLPALVVVVMLAGCGLPQEPEIMLDQEPESTLPPPAVHLASLPVQTVLAIESDSVQDVPVHFSETPADLARSIYGERLIDWIKIDAVEVLAPVTPVGWSSDGSLDNPEAVEWDSPGAKVGWVIDSALPGDESGNVILYGHNNINSSVFRDLAELQAGAEIMLTTGGQDWMYEVSAVHILPVSGSNGDRADYAQHLLPGMVPRLTLISCWPPDNNTHRVIVVAYEKTVNQGK